MAAVNFTKKQNTLTGGSDFFVATPFCDAKSTDLKAKTVTRRRIASAPTPLRFHFISRHLDCQRQGISKFRQLIKLGGDSRDKLLTRAKHNRGDRFRRPLYFCSRPNCFRPDPAAASLAFAPKPKNRCAFLCAPSCPADRK